MILNDRNDAIIDYMREKMKVNYNFTNLSPFLPKASMQNYAVVLPDSTMCNETAHYHITSWTHKNQTKMKLYPIFTMASKLETHTNAE